VLVALHEAHLGGPDPPAPPPGAQTSARSPRDSAIFWPTLIDAPMISPACSVRAATASGTSAASASVCELDGCAGGDCWQQATGYRLVARVAMYPTARRVPGFVPNPSPIGGRELST
jgi:hypothetical protein